MWRTLKFMLDRASAEAWQVIVAVGLCLLLPALAALVLWPAGLSRVGLSLLKGFGLFWVFVFVLFALAAWVQRRLRVDLYTHPDAFVVSNMLVSGLLMLGWAAFAALLAREAAAAAGLWLAGLLYLVGLLSGVVACQVVGSFYSGHIYKFAALIVGCAGFVLFAAWPAAGRAAFGWLFGLF
ncbi:MAG TPA: hypothetical protein VN282_28285 [Pyrinomonadaceae bacterium]|nr:hypothetical protein [Pyrinomonadaceae bacterium]